jgi:hypothetical protein
MDVVRLLVSVLYARCSVEKFFLEESMSSFLSYPTFEAAIVIGKGRNIAFAFPWFSNAFENPYRATIT